MLALALIGCSAKPTSPEALVDRVVAAIVAGDAAACQAQYNVVELTAREAERDGEYAKAQAEHRRVSCDACVALLKGARHDGKARCMLPPSSPMRVFDCTLGLADGDVTISAGDFGGEYRMVELACAKR